MREQRLLAKDDPQLPHSPPPCVCSVSSESPRMPYVCRLARRYLDFPEDRERTPATRRSAAVVGGEGGSVSDPHPAWISRVIPEYRAPAAVNPPTYRTRDARDRLRKSGVTLTSSEVTGCLTVAVIHLSMSLDVGTLMDPLNP
ncbi:hypothetical protein F2P81_004170 [Scophthalmus maximus]|uniref:Uncharacterized protein n=1 Tax=Scophthalmus maximus TaxID=52904 RepID=A0A6A4T9T2_SCOMX|nr:hypothetical protein F2P81_004170 [Scophthalmus maximus]